MTTTNSTEVFRKPYLTTGLYALALLLFLLPFFDIKCNDLSMAKLSGISMATGGKPSVSRELNDMQKSASGTRNNTSASVAGEGELFITALLALILGVAGLVYSLVDKGTNQRVGMYIGILGVLALIGSWFQVSSYVSHNAKMHSGSAADDQFAGMIRISASPTFWFILCLLCFAAAAFISYRKTQTAVIPGEEPPEAAPQIKLRNPGDQSEFPSAPEGERDLG